MSLFSELIAGKALTLLAMINEDLKPRDHYKINAVMSHKSFKIFGAIDRNGSQIFNILTDTGDFPSGMPTNWRVASHIVQELKITIKR